MSSPIRAVWSDGQIQMGETLLISAWHPAFTGGEGLFETFRTIQGRIPSLDLHLRRLRWAAGRMSYPGLPDHDYEALCQDLLRAAGLEDGRFRLTLCPPSARPSLILALESLDHELLARRAEGVRLLSSPYRIGERDPSRSMKLVSRAYYSLCEREALARGGDEPLLLGDHGEIRETSRANLFAYSESEGLLTPTLVDAFLPGVTRTRLLARARILGIPVQERTLMLEDLAGCQEVFLTNALSLAYPVLAVDEMEFAPGPMLERCLHELSSREGDPGAT